MKSGYSIAQVAKQVGVSYRTIKRRVEDGIIPAKKFGPKTTRIDRKTLVRMRILLPEGVKCPFCQPPETSRLGICGAMRGTS